MRTLMLALTALTALNTAAHADAIIFNQLGSNSPFNAPRSPNSAPVGKVTFTQDTTITRFGVFDALSTAGNQTFYIFDSTGDTLYQSAPKAFAGDGGTGINLDSYKVSDPFAFTFLANTSYAVGATADVSAGYYVAYDAVTQNGITVTNNNGNIVSGQYLADSRCCSTGLVFYADAAGTPTAVPEPATLALLGAGLLGLGVVRRRR